jgi:hypothetical protein
MRGGAGPAAVSIGFMAISFGRQTIATAASGVKNKTRTSPFSGALGDRLACSWAMRAQQLRLTVKITLMSP